MRCIIVLYLLLSSHMAISATLDKLSIVQTLDGKHVVVLEKGVATCLKVKDDNVWAVDYSKSCQGIKSIGVDEQGKVCILYSTGKKSCAKVRKMDNGKLVAGRSLKPLLIYDSKDDMMQGLDELGIKVKPGEIANRYYKEANDLYEQSDYQQALELYLKAAEFGHTQSEFRIGYILGSGKGVEKDKKEAKKWYLKAANKGHLIAQYNLANALRFDNPDEAVKWYEKSANGGYASAQNNLGWMYTMGHIGGWSKPDEALKWYKMSAENGNKVGQYNVCLIYYKKGAHKYTKAKKWCKLAADQGYHNADKLLERMDSW